MDYNKQTARRLTLIILVFFAVASAIVVALWHIAGALFENGSVTNYSFWVISTLLLLYFLARLLSNVALKPLRTLFNVIVFAGHSNRGGAAPNTDKLHLGRKLVTSLARQVYDLASISKQSIETTAQPKGAATTPALAQTAPASSAILDHIAMPLIGIDSAQNVTIINRVACEYLNKKPEEVIGKPIFDAMSLSFQSEETFELWLKNSQANVAVGSRVWERVRIVDETGSPQKQFDLVASFSKNNQTGTETMLAVYDRSQKYLRDDSEVSFVALAVHELRTPLTVLKGYIEVFEDELGPTLSPELASFMHKMKASAQQLTAFVGNILNVARVEEDQLSLKLQQYKWQDIINYAVQDLQLRAEVNGKHIEVKTADNLPPVAVDRISIHEVINNLVDNAIKYSDKSDKIVITSSLNGSGMVEVSVRDYGIGIPAAVMPDLFQKFYRSHKSKVQIGGTGLGLYLCKALIGAHGGHIWVRSKEGEGSTFSFTIQPYDKVKHEQAEGQDGIMRGAHGWIKNHSLNRQ